MTEKRYCLKQKSSGLYFNGVKYIPPPLKNGKPRKGRTPYKMCHLFIRQLHLVEDAVARDLESLKCEIYNATDDGFLFDENNYELECWEWKKTPNRVSLKNMLSDIEQEVIVEKLKNGN